MCHVEKVYSVKTKNTVSIYYFLANVTLKSFENCALLEVASIFLSLVFEKILQMEKRLVKMIRCRYGCYQIVEGIARFLLGKTSLPVDFRLFNCLILR